MDPFLPVVPIPIRIAQGVALGLGHACAGYAQATGEWMRAVTLRELSAWWTIAYAEGTRRDREYFQSLGIHPAPFVGGVSGWSAGQDGPVPTLEWTTATGRLHVVVRDQTPLPSVIARITIWAGPADDRPPTEIVMLTISSTISSNGFVAEAKMLRPDLIEGREDRLIVIPDVVRGLTEVGLDLRNPEADSETMPSAKELVDRAFRARYGKDD